MKLKQRRHQKRPTTADTKPVTATLLMSGFAHDGRAVGRIEGIPWFVSGAIDGETVVATSRRVYSNRVEAVVRQVVEPASSRVIPPCDKFVQCGGCSLQFMAVDQQRMQKQVVLQRELARQADTTLTQWADSLLGTPVGYRARARMSIRAGKVGFTSAGSHQHVALKNCPVMVAPLNNALKAMPELPLAKAEMEWRVADDGKVGVHLICAQQPSHSQLTQLHELLDSVADGLWISGPDGVRHILKHCDMQVATPLDNMAVSHVAYPWQFSQINPEINRRMILQAIDWLDIGDGSRVLDLFAGSGNFSVPMALRGAHVVAVESDAIAVQQGKENAEANGCTTVDFIKQDLFVSGWNRHWGKMAFDAVLLDPPRAGADEVCKEIAQFDVKRIVYVSCNPATLARDSRTLTSLGYRIQKSGLIDMFPHTGHIESMTLFQKGK